MKIKTEWTTVSIPKSMARKLRKLVGHQGFTSVGDIAMFCIRGKMHQIDIWLDQVEKEDILHDIKQG